MRNETDFFLGVLTGALLVVCFTYLFPHNVRSVNEQLIKEGLAYYSPIKGEVIWKECVKNDK
jgi:endonuclease YncB( thermonuclease family)